MYIDWIQRLTSTTSTQIQSDTVKDPSVLDKVLRLPICYKNIQIESGKFVKDVYRLNSKTDLH